MSTYTRTVNGITFTRENDIITLDGTCTAATNITTGLVLNDAGVVSIDTEEIVLPGDNNSIISFKYTHISGTADVVAYGSVTKEQSIILVPINSDATELTELNLYPLDAELSNVISLTSSSNVRSIVVKLYYASGTVFDNYKLKIEITSDYETKSDNFVDIGILDNFLDYIPNYLTNVFHSASSSIQAYIYRRSNNMFTLHQLLLGTSSFIKLTTNFITSSTNGALYQSDAILSSGTHIILKFKPIDSTWTLSGSSSEFKITLRSPGSSSSTALVDQLLISAGTPDSDGYYTLDTTLTADVGCIALYAKGVTCHMLTFIISLTTI